MPDPVSSVIGIGSSLIGANASKSAAKTQANAANNATKEARKQFNQSREDLLAQRKSGQDEILKARAQGRTDLLGGQSNGLDAILSGENAALSYQQPYYNTGTAANNKLSMYLGLDPSQSGEEGYGSLVKPFTMADLELDPGYKFRMEQGQKALERAYAGKGKYFSGEAMKGLSNYNQEAASQEYGNAYNRYNTNQNNIYSRLFGEQQTGQAAGNNMSNIRTNAANNRASIYTNTANELSNLDFNSANAFSNIGLNSANQIANLGQNKANTVGNNMMAAGDAKAAGTVGAANAWQTGLNNIGENYLYETRRAPFLFGGA